MSNDNSNSSNLKFRPTDKDDAAAKELITDVCHLSSNIRNNTPKRKIQYRCDICSEQVFQKYEDAVAHEEECALIVQEMMQKQKRAKMRDELITYVMGAEETIKKLQSTWDVPGTSLPPEQQRQNPQNQSQSQNSAMPPHWARMMHPPEYYCTPTGTPLYQANNSNNMISSSQPKLPDQYFNSNNISDELTQIMAHNYPRQIREWASLPMCKFPGCNIRVSAKEIVCSLHYSKGTMCAVSGCHEIIQAIGEVVCAAHKHSTIVNKCSDPKCNRPAPAGHVCLFHMRKVKRECEIPLCKAPGCKTKVLSKLALCQVHDYKGQMCVAPRCLEIIQTSGKAVCAAHADKIEKCKVYGCKNTISIDIVEYFNNRVCNTHGSSLDSAAVSTVKCKVYGCKNTISSNNVAYNKDLVCNTHGSYLASAALSVLRTRKHTSAQSSKEE